ncbi:MAG: 4-hydroxy-tetrahydrodipicolinate reductase [Hyphomonadaceae bacterium]|nr:4-hydroxy-tetrahydrodipicolinate reductase [Hyphomonadaceae bacterium]
MPDVINIGVLGAEGRMGAAIILALKSQPEARLSVAITSPRSNNIGIDAGVAVGISECDVNLTADIQTGLDICDVMIDFSSPEAAIDAALGMHETRCRSLITGTTGYTETEEAALLAASGSITLLKSGNFSLGVNLLEALVETASSKLGPDWDIEILDMHHRHKVDAPSGTAIMLGQAAAKGRNVELSKTQILSRRGPRVAREEGQIGFAALRGGGIIGDHEVRLASELEMITLGHSAFDRSVFAEGAIRAAIWAASQPGGLYSMRDVLGV